MTAHNRTPHELAAWLHEAGEEDAVSNTPRDYYKAAAAAPQEPAKAPSARATQPERKPVTAAAPASAPIAPAMSHTAAVRLAEEMAAKSNTMEELEQAVRAFDGCALKKFATNTVFCDGAKDAKIMLIGEAPGATEDEEGIPFCGASGKLLDKMLGSIGLDRSKNVYITNTIFWRPPGNRTPTREELEICEPFVTRQVQLMKPRFLIFCGGTSATFLLRSKVGITKLRGKLHEYVVQGVDNPLPAAVLFHPSYLLRTPAQKKLAWQDLLQMKQYMDANGILSA